MPTTRKPTLAEPVRAFLKQQFGAAWRKVVEEKVLADDTFSFRLMRVVEDKTHYAISIGILRGGGIQIFSQKVLTPEEIARGVAREMGTQRTFGRQLAAVRALPADVKGVMDREFGEGQWEPRLALRPEAEVSGFLTHISDPRLARLSPKARVRRAAKAALGR